MDEIRAAVERAVRESLVGGGGEWVVEGADGTDIAFSFRRTNGIADGTTEIRGDDGQVEHRLQVCVLAK
jgi:hypothetical protein